MSRARRWRWWICRGWIPATFTDPDFPASVAKKEIVKHWPVFGSDASRPPALDLFGED